MKKAVRKPNPAGAPLDLGALAAVLGGQVDRVRLPKGELDGDGDTVDLKSERVQ